MSRKQGAIQLIQTESRRLLALLREHREEGRGGQHRVHVTAIALGSQPEVHVAVGRQESSR